MIIQSYSGAAIAVLVNLTSFQLLHGVFIEEWNALVSMESVAAIEFKILKKYILRADAVAKADLLLSVGGTIIILTYISLVSY